MGKESNVFVLGNGTSRLRFDLEKLREHGFIYGCNAIYRDFIPDKLFAVDTAMIKEFHMNKVFEKTEICIPIGKFKSCSDYSGGMTALDGHRRKGTGCGFTALNNAIADGFENIYMIGFDLHPKDERPYQYFNNVYANSLNYKGDRDSPPNSARYIPKLVDLAYANKHVKFIRAYDIETGYIPDEWINKKLDNIIHISNIELAEELDVLVQEDTYTR